MTEGSTDQDKQKLRVAMALFALYFFWGGTYIGMRVAIESFPPFLMAGIRFVSAGLVLFSLARYQGAGMPDRRQWLNAGIVGALLLLGGNGIVAWAEKTVPSGIAALILATVPIWIVLMNWIGKGKTKPNMGIITGILLGMVGIAIMVIRPGSTADGGKISIIGLLALVFAAFSWSVGSLLSRSIRLPDSAIQSTGMQMLTGGTLLLGASVFAGDWAVFNLQSITGRSLIALFYLISCGSIIGYSAYIWLLKNAEPTWVSTYAFVNPVVAVFLGWLIAGETLSVNTAVAALIIIAAVVIITVFRDKPQKQSG